MAWTCPQDAQRIWTVAEVARLPESGKSPGTPANMRFAGEFTQRPPSTSALLAVAVACEAQVRRISKHLPKPGAGFPLVTAHPQEHFSIPEIADKIAATTINGIALDGRVKCSHFRAASLRSQSVMPGRPRRTGEMR